MPGWEGVTRIGCMPRRMSPSNRNSSSNVVGGLLLALVSGIVQGGVSRL